tara:strand:- start:243 stop:617 length:375 start_codon:yes stop_codon:yes gene_type:complete
MSTLKTSNIQDTSGNNNSTPEQINQGRAKAWVSFDGTATDVSSTANGYNVSTITDEGDGQYTINFTTDFANTNYAVTHGATYAAGNGYYHFYDNEAVGSISIRFISSAGSYTNPAHVSCVVFGD